ncbi:MAG: PAS domain-containing protein, partial [Planctomycetota bacterium]
LTETPPVADIRLGYVPGLLVLVLALAATAVVIAAQLLDWPAMVDAAVPPLVMSIVIWLLVLANAVSRIKARCARTLVARLHRQNRVALGTVQSAPGLISALQPDGRRTRTNGAWTAVTGCSETVLLEHGWLDIVHTEDREACRSSFADPDAPPTQLEFSIVAADGGNRWIRERIAPRLDDDGTVLELIACGVDVTEHVRADAERLDRIVALEAELHDARKMLETETAARIDAEKSARKSERAAQRSTDKLERVERESVDTVERVTKETAAELERVTAESTASVEQARSELTSTTTALRAAETRRDALMGEVEQLNTSLREMQSLVTTLESAEGDLRDRLVRQGKQHAKERTEVEEARDKESRYRASSDRLREQVKSLEDETEHLRECLSTAIDERDTARAEVETARNAVAEDHHGAAHALLAELDTLGRAAQRRADALEADDDSGGAAEHLVDAQIALDELITAIGRARNAEACDPGAGDPRSRTFELRGLLETVGATTLEPELPISVNVPSDLPTMLCGDPVRLREIFHGLLRPLATLPNVEGIDLGVDRQTGTDTHVTLCFTLALRGEHVSRAELVEALGLESEGATPPSHDVAVAWAVVKRLDGSYGIEGEDSTAAWFTVNLLKRDLTGQHKHRTSGRVPCELLECNLGTVTEMGADGMQVIGKRVPRDDVEITFDVDGVETTVQARVTGSERLGVRRHSVELEFMGLTGEESHTIMRIATMHRCQAAA